MVNGRIKLFDKSGSLGGLNATLDNFFTRPPTITVSNSGDPNVRYDRLSGRWFVTALDFTSPNRILIAVSSSSTITDTSNFTVFQFVHDQVGGSPNPDTGKDADYDSLGVDKNSLYIGINVFSGLSLSGTTGFVVNKSDLLTGTLTVTAFRSLAVCAPFCSSGPFSPRGVQNDDPAASEGYFIGVDAASLSLLTMRQVTYSGITPMISPNITLTVPTTTFPINVVAQGVATPLDAIDDRLFAAQIRKNKLTGDVSLWTAHNIEVNASGVGTMGGGRTGSRWYEIRNLTTTPTLYQSGTLYDPAASNPRSYWIPSVAMSGQGHMALGASFASVNDYAGVAVAGRLSSDALGTIQSPTLAQSGLGSYDLGGDIPRRWGDYSQTVVDPNDDMTMWTFQEYAHATNLWGVRVIQLIAPPPATVSNLVPSSAPQGQVSFSVTVTGTSTSGSGWFDPGSDAGGPGFRNHISARVTGGVIVNSVTFNSPTQLTINVATFCANTGAQDVIITNPDGQSMTASGVLTITSAPTTCHQYIFPLIYR